MRCRLVLVVGKVGIDLQGARHIRRLVVEEEDIAHTRPDHMVLAEEVPAAARHIALDAAGGTANPAAADRVTHAVAVEDMANPVVHRMGLEARRMPAGGAGAGRPIAAVGGDIAHQAAAGRRVVGRTFVRLRLICVGMWVLSLSVVVDSGVYSSTCMRLCR